MFFTYTEYSPNTKTVKGYNGVTSFESGYGSVRLICELTEEQTEIIILQEVVHFLGSFNLISQSQIMDTDVNIEPVNHYGLNISNPHGKLNATAPQFDGQFVLDRVLDRTPESTNYTDIDDSCLLALKTTGHASRHDAEKQMLWHSRLAHVDLKALEILRNVAGDAPKMTGKCDCESCIKCKSA